MLRPVRACWSAHAVGIAGHRPDIGSRASAPDGALLHIHMAGPAHPERGRRGCFGGNVGFALALGRSMRARALKWHISRTAAPSPLTSWFKITQYRC